MYESLTGELPVDATERFASETLVPPRKLAPQIDSLLEQIIVKGMNMKVQDRFQTVDELLKVLTGSGQGDAYNNLKEYQQAIDYLQKSLAISQPIGVRDLEAESWFHVGNTRKNLQQKSEAKTAYENSRELYQAMGLDKKVEECDKAIQDLVNNDLD